MDAESGSLVVTHDSPLPASVMTAATPLKPRLRGWLHTWAFVVSLVTGSALIAVTSPTLGQRAGIATAVYALSLSALFGTSALYHRGNWQVRAKQVLRHLDHSMIFVFIAGTYTPLALLVLPAGPGAMVFAVVWIGAAVGVALTNSRAGKNRWFITPTYLALGWVAVLVMPALLQAGVAPFVLLLVGGALYSIGAVVYATRWPDPSPRIFGFHEVFHLCTVVAAVSHYIAIWLAIYH